MMKDIRFALRGLLKRPAFTVIAVLTLALGIGANTAIFSVVNAVLLQPLPLKDPDRLMTFWHSAPAKGLRHLDLNDALFAYYRERTHTFESIAAYEGGDVALTGNGDPEVVPAAAITYNYFSVLGREPLYGRAFTAKEDTPGNNNVAILSYSLWQRRFGGYPNVVGQSINLDSNPTTIVGIMPADFDFPDPAERPGNSGHVQLWVPKGLNPQDASSWNLMPVGRLRSGATPDDAQKEITALYQAFTEERGVRPGTSDLGSTETTTLLPLQRHIVGEVRRPLLLLLGAIALVLLIACANLTNLLLARAAARTRELAVRQCLGASALRIARQTLTESLLLSLFGTALGVLIAVWIVTALKRMVASQIPHVESVGVDITVLLFTIAIMLATGVLCGLAPALRAARINLQDAIKEGARGSASGANKRLNNLFVVSQLALSLVLLIGAALFLQSFRNLLSVNPGFRAENVLMARVALPEQKYDKPQAVRFFEQLRQNVSGVPGVQAVELCQVVPFSGDGQGGPFLVEGVGQEDEKVAWLRSSTPGYFAAMGMPILKGRAFTSSDTESSLPVAIVDERLARMYSPDGDLVGKRLRIGNGPWLTIVGVVPNVKNRKLDEEAWPYVYRPYNQWVRRETMLVVRASVDPTALAANVRQEVAKLDPELPLSKVSTIQQAMDRSLVTTRLTNSLLAGFAATALLLALTGIYGVMSLNVANRRGEFGIRLALGAQTANVLRMILGQGLRLAIVAVAVGLLGAFALTRLLKGLLFGISASDPLTFAVIALVLIGVALLACWIPARRATKVDPLEALRSE
ncbi:MAG TPA: ABC transporter permease [Pyrinomonadaceae bacterium]